MIINDLKTGYCIEMRDGTKCLFCQGGKFIILDDGAWHTTLDQYRDDLTDIDDETDYDIMKVYEDCSLKKVIWERNSKNKLRQIYDLIGEMLKDE